MQKHEGTLIIVDDDPDVLFSAELFLKQYFEKVIALNRPTAIIAKAIEHKANVVLLDMNYQKGRNDGQEGLQWLKSIKAELPHCQAIVMTAYGEVSTAVEAMKRGAADFIVKPWQNEKLLATVSNAMKLSLQSKELNQLKKEKEWWQPTSEPLEFIGESAAIQRVKELVDQVGPTDANVLITGENGTGKEIVAHLIHQASERKAKPFIKVDLGAVHETLFESELFGAKKGAYTDLKADKTGRIEQAHKGTLFLDEIGNLKPSLQSKLLSVLQNREVIPVGGNKPKPTDIRLVSATNAPLQKMIAEGEFRQDFLYRINTIEIHIPPLRERPEDIAPIAQYFLKKYCSKYRKPGLRMGSEVLKTIQRQPWKGNVRELQHAIERAVILSNDKSIDPTILTNQGAVEMKGEAKTLDELEKRHIEKSIRKHSGNISKTADELGITRAALYRRMEKHGLS